MNEELKKANESQPEKAQEKAEEKPQEPKKPVEEPKAEEKPKEPEKPKEQTPQQTHKREPLQEGVVLVGKKPTNSYVLASMAQFTDELKEITIKAMGINIARAVDVSEVLKNRYLKGQLTDKIVTGTRELQGTDRKTGKPYDVNVSTIEITLRKSG